MYDLWNTERAEFEDLVGKTIISIVQTRDDRNDSLNFHTECGKHYVMTHFQDCCESVGLVDLDEDLSDLIGSPVVYAEERVDSGEGSYDDSWTNTFYHLATNKGSTVIRWEGSSNGYYSESVDFVLVSDKTESTVH